MKKKELLLIILKCVVALTVFCIAVVNYDTLSDIDVESLLSVTDSLPLMIGIILSLYFVKALVFVIPASIIYVAVGAAVNPVLAVFVNLTGIFIEVSVTYFFGKFLGKDAVYKLLSKKESGKKILAKDIQNKASVLFSIRAIPAFPIDFISLFYGASGCNYGKYALFSVLGISWRVVLFTLLGDVFFKWIPMDKIILAVICAIPVGIVFYTVKKFVIEPKNDKGKEKAPPDDFGGANSERK